VSWLNELLFIYEVKGKIFLPENVEIDLQGVKLLARGTLQDAPRPVRAVKAVTYGGAEITGYGPEVITVNELASDIPFTVYVHDFTNTAKESGSWALASSGAKVSIKFKGNRQPLVFNVPSGEGTLWKVCTIYEGKVTGVNTMSYEGRPLNIGAND